MKLEKAVWPADFADCADYYEVTPFRRFIRWVSDLSFASALESA